MKFKVVILVAFLIIISSALAQDSLTGKYRDEYLLKKGDKLSIEVMDHPEFTKQVQILPDGSIEYPILGSMRVSEISAHDLSEVIKQSLQPYVTIPIVTVYVTNIYGESINIIGYVNKPGSYQIFESLGLMDALAMAGGIENIRKIKYVKVIRKNGEMMNIRLSDLWEKSTVQTASTDKLLLHAGDNLIVPPPREVNWAKINTIVSIIAASIGIYNAFN